MMSEADVAWLAGLFEGEGSSRLCRSRREVVSARVQITLGDRDVLEHVPQITGCGAIHVSKKAGWKAGRNASYQWVAWDPVSVWWIVDAVRPFMGTRRTTQINAMEQEAHFT